MSDTDTVSPVAPGDIVRLKSGGPPMTVSRIHEGTEEAECMWFSGGSALGSVAVAGPVDRKFPIVALVRVEPA